MEELQRVPAGRVNGISAEPGTYLGPKAVTREYVVVTGPTEGGVAVGYARVEDSDRAATERWIADPRSVTEVALVIGHQRAERTRFLNALASYRPDR